MERVPREALAIRHLAFEDLGVFEAVLSDGGWDVRYVDIGLDPLSAVDLLQADLLFVLGGPIGAYEEDRYPFLRGEIDHLQRRLREDLPTFGICLGAQLLARALGASVKPAAAKEIGIAPLQLTGPGQSSCLAAFAETPVLHWHGDTFDLPNDALRLASTQACENQAFCWGDNVLATQFHPEAGGLGFERWLIGHTAELAASCVDVGALRDLYAEHAMAMASAGRECLSAWLTKTFG